MSESLFPSNRNGVWNTLMLSDTLNLCNVAVGDLSRFGDSIGRNRICNSDFKANYSTDRSEKRIKRIV